MKAVVYHGPGVARLEEVPTPAPGPGEVLLQVKACALCGTDLRILRSGHRAVRPPAIIGHEISGEVVAVGGEVSGVREGDRVIVVTPVGCRACRFCKRGMQNMCPRVSRDVHSIGYYCAGGFAEYLLVPREAVENGNLLPFPSTLDFPEAALVEPLSCVLNGQQFLGIAPGEVVAIFGAGPVGILHGMLAKERGAAQVLIIDPSSGRRARAVELGVADRTFDALQPDLTETVRRATSGWGADVTITACSAHRAQEQAMEVTGIRGRISFFGGLPKDQPSITLNSNALHYAEQAVYGAFASSHAHYREALGLLRDRRLDVRPLITHRVPLSRFFEAVSLVERGEGLKAVVVPSLAPV